MNISNHNPQLSRYKKLLSFIDEHYNEEINIEKVEGACNYSYRNINRIFEALHHETIGKYVKRLRLEKGAQYLKYSSMGVSQIAYEVGFEDRSAFSKAFKKKYNQSPKAFRENNESIRKTEEKAFLLTDTKRVKLDYEVEYLPDFDYISIEYRGDYLDISAIEKKWELLCDYAEEKGWLSDNSILMTEIIDDHEISDHINSRYNQAIIVEKPQSRELKDLFRIQSHKRQKYARFTHVGSHQSCFDFYHKIYALWIVDVDLELVDRPILEFYPNLDDALPDDELITEIYIPVA